MHVFGVYPKNFLRHLRKSPISEKFLKFTDSQSLNPKQENVSKDKHFQLELKLSNVAAYFLSYVTLKASLKNPTFRVPSILSSLSC